MTTILFCPVRERPDVLALTLEAHRKLEGVSERWYFDDNDDRNEPRSLLARETSVAYFLYCETVRPDQNYRDHQWNPSLTERLSKIRDAAIERFLNSRADALFMIDADVLPHPETVKHLESLNLPIVSEVYWSQWGKWIRSAWLPNVWDAHQYAFESLASIARLTAPGQYRVNGLGAITLIRRETLEKGCRYASIPGVPFVGEDRHFCIRAAVLGIPLWADTCFPAFHVYRQDEQLEEAKAWYAAGCPPEYFREKWLTEEWEKQLCSV